MWTARTSLTAFQSRGNRALRNASCPEVAGFRVAPANFALLPMSSDSKRFRSGDMPVSTNGRNVADEEEQSEYERDSQDEESEDRQSAASTPALKRKKRRRVSGQKVSKRTKDKLATARKAENSKVIHLLDISVGDEVVLHKSDSAAQCYGDFEFPKIPANVSPVNYSLFGCTPVGVWTVTSIEDGIFHLQVRHTTSRNAEFRDDPGVWAEMLKKGYRFGHTARIGAYELFHRMLDKTALHARTKPIPDRKESSLQDVCLRVLAKLDRSAQEREVLPPHLLERLSALRTEIIPIPIEYRLAHLARGETGEPIVFKAKVDWTAKVWRFRPNATSYELIWRKCARTIIKTRPTTTRRTGLCLEPEQGAAAFMADYLAACRRRDRKFIVTFDHAWEVRSQPRVRGGCLGGDNAVLVRSPVAAAGGEPLGWTHRLVRDVRAGDVVLCDGGAAAVVAAWRAPAGPACSMVLLRGVWLTPDHPVLDTAAGRWCRADAIAPPPQPTDADSVYNLAVETSRGVLVVAGPGTAAAGDGPANEPVVCATLGQAVPGMEDPVWGTPLILAWMRAQPGWPNLSADIPLLGGPPCVGATDGIVEEPVASWGGSSHVACPRARPVAALG